MNDQWLFDALPLEVEYKILKWLVEFHRVDAVERYNHHKLNYTNNMKNICEDIRLNVPYYSFSILYTDDRCLSVSLFAREMNPIKTAYDVLRIPSSLISYRRRALSLPISQRFHHNRNTIQELAKI